LHIYNTDCRKHPVITSHQGNGAPLESDRQLRPGTFKEPVCVQAVAGHKPPPIQGYALNAEGENSEHEKQNIASFADQFPEIVWAFAVTFAVRLATSGERR
jgi:hypothetical protein